MTLSDLEQQALAALGEQLHPQPRPATFVSVGRYVIALAVADDAHSPVLQLDAVDPHELAAQLRLIADFLEEDET